MAKEIAYATEKPCAGNAGIDCNDRRKCHKCGFNPKVQRRKIARIRAEMIEKSKRPKFIYQYSADDGKWHGVEGDDK